MVQFVTRQMSHVSTRAWAARTEAARAAVGGASVGPLCAYASIQQNSEPPASGQIVWSVGKLRRVAEQRSASPESPDILIWERREICGTSPGFLAERLPYLVMDWGRKERGSQGWIRLNLYPGHMCVHDNMVAFLPVQGYSPPAARFASLHSHVSLRYLPSVKRASAPKVGANACFWNWR